MKLKSALASAASVVLLFTVAGCSGGDDNGGNTDSGDDNGGNTDNGGDTDFVDLSAEEIVEAAKDAVQNAESLRFSGEVDSNGQVIGLEIALDSDGNCDGWVSIDGARANVRRVDGSSWIQADKDFWTFAGGAEGAQIAQQVGDKWVVDESGDFSAFCNLDEMFEGDDGEETYTKGEVSEVDGQDAIAVEVADEDDTVSTIHVAVAEPHHLLRGTVGGEGEMVFSDYDEPLEIEAPDEADQIDQDDLR